MYCTGYMPRTGTTRTVIATLGATASEVIVEDVRGLSDHNPIRAELTCP